MVLSEQLLPSSYHAGSRSEWLLFKAKENKTNQYNFNIPVLIVMLQWWGSITVRQSFAHQKNETWFPSFPGSRVSTCGFSEQALPAVTLLLCFQVLQWRNQNTQFQNTFTELLKSYYDVQCNWSAEIFLRHIRSHKDLKELFSCMVP